MVAQSAKNHHVAPWKLFLESRKSAFKNMQITFVCYLTMVWLNTQLFFLYLLLMLLLKSAWNFYY